MTDHMLSPEMRAVLREHSKNHPDKFALYDMYCIVRDNPTMSYADATEVVLDKMRDRAGKRTLDNLINAVFNEEEV